MGSSIHLPRYFFQSTDIRAKGNRNAQQRSPCICVFSLTIISALVLQGCLKNHYFVLEITRQFSEDDQLCSSLCMVSYLYGVVMKHYEQLTSWRKSSFRLMVQELHLCVLTGTTYNMETSGWHGSQSNKLRACYLNLRHEIEKSKPDIGKALYFPTDP